MIVHLGNNLRDQTVLQMLLLAIYLSLALNQPLGLTGEYLFEFSFSFLSIVRIFVRMVL